MQKQYDGLKIIVGRDKLDLSAPPLPLSSLYLL